MFLGQCYTDIIYELYTGHGWHHLVYATIQVFDEWPPWRRGGFSPGTSCLLFSKGTFLVSEDMQLQWDPGGGRHSGLRASRNLRGPECHVQLIQRTRPSRHGSCSSVAWAERTYASEYIQRRSFIGKDIQELNRTLAAPVPLSRPLPLQWPLSTSAVILLLTLR
jgi:hypothetical protein